ncbi:hypothetical protein AWJ20_160 [Sugiyamaella lignohabitans]|uniref:Pirin N-terminal domain-containing protein n=1 Tax=Sugiyamaella lignohabitans TaxID=796027 RepID=A0A167CNT4_9ASCO|nr:uncharacterized protein AWJ20_160 [Sugiyamaella lignohabitans]ANB11933.1 hypothetical protein AWJ20_160 [Sugiyamaella lignohabitans]
MFKVTLRGAATRRFVKTDWITAYQSFGEGPKYQFAGFGNLEALNEDRFPPRRGVNMHHHNDHEIFTYMLSGGLTHRDTMAAKEEDKSYTIHRGDVQFISSGSGIRHSEKNAQGNEVAHLLQFWVKPWKNCLGPRYETKTFSEADKRKGFVTIISPFSEKENSNSQPVVPGSIAINSDFSMGAAIIPPGEKFSWTVTGAANASGNSSVGDPSPSRNIYVYLPSLQDGLSKIKVAGQETLSEGDGAFVENIRPGDLLEIESVGEKDAEVVVTDSA